jgi:hypothetical protein
MVRLTCGRGSVRGNQAAGAGLTLRQATWWPGSPDSTGSSGGTTLVHRFSSRNWQRGLKLHPLGKSAASATSPRTTSLLGASGSGTGTAAIKACVYRWVGAVLLALLCRLDDAPGIHHRDPVAHELDDRQVV